MGCNTSKETVPTTEEKENEANNEEVNKTGDNEQIENQETTTEKSAVQIRKSSSQSRPTSVVRTSKVRNSTHQITEAVNGIGDEGGLEQAATKIQAAFRGHKTRQSMKQADKPDAQQAADATEDLANEFRADDPELCNAATKIQASFRGHMARKKVENVKAENGAENKNEVQHDEDDFDIDLNDPDLNKAATKIQATFRTHMKHKDE